MTNFQFSCFLSTIAAFVVFFYSLNVFYYETGREYLQVKLNEAKFASVDGTCLIRATVIHKKLTDEGNPARILIFFCRKAPDTTFGHAVCIYQSGNYLAIFDNDASNIVCKLSELDLDSDPKKVISKKYNYVVEAQWLNVDNIK